MKDATNRWQTAVETQFDYYKTDLEAETKEAEMTAKGVVELARVEKDNASNE
jgi:hypothetical protein